MVPNTIKSHKEAYLSFIFVHPDWRSPINPNQNHISIGQYMLFYLIQVNLKYIIFIIYLKYPRRLLVFLSGILRYLSENWFTADWYNKCREIIAN